MLETNTVVAVAIFCILSIFLAILRPRILRNSARIAEYLGKVDPGQEAIPVDEKCWYYSTSKDRISLPNRSWTLGLRGIADLPVHWIQA